MQEEIKEETDNSTSKRHVAFMKLLKAIEEVDDIDKRRNLRLCLISYIDEII